MRKSLLIYNMSLSRTDPFKGHDFQYWSRPLQFAPDGMIKQLAWDETVKVSLAHLKNTP
jgi:hypothetical protein